MAPASPQVNEVDLYAPLGRLFHFIRDRGLRDYLPQLDWWLTPGQSGWAVEWQDGPYVDEVVLKLFRASVYDEADIYDDTLFQQVEVEPGLTATRGNVRICGVPFSLRALDPVGYETTRERVWSNLHRLLAERRQPSCTAADGAAAITAEGRTTTT